MIVTDLGLDQCFSLPALDVSRHRDAIITNMHMDRLFVAKLCLLDVSQAVMASLLGAVSGL